MQDCDHSQALFELSDSATDVWNHGFALLAVMFASFNNDNRLIFLFILSHIIDVDLAFGVNHVK